MKIIELDLTGCKTTWEVHQRIREVFAFPEWYGNNWDAFWDLLRSECDADQVLIRGEHILPRELDRDLAIMHQCLEDNVKEHEEYSKYGSKPFSYRIIN